MKLGRRPRPLRLLEVAARAQVIIWRRGVQGILWRTALGTLAVVVAGMFLLGLHVALWTGLAPVLGPVGSALAVAVIDLVLCLGLAWAALRSAADPVARDAGAVRDDALRGAQAMLNPLGRLRRRPVDVPVSTRARRARVYPALR